MYNFLYKLNVSGHLKFTEGHIQVFGHPSLMIIPEEAFLSLQEEFLKIDSLRLYKVGKKAGEELYELIAHYTVNPNRIFALGIDLINFSGFGKLRVINKRLDEGRVIFHMEDSIAAKIKTNEHACHYMRGVLAGFIGRITKKDVECTEEQCMAIGNRVCEFMVKERNEFNPNSEIVKKQLKF